MGQANVPHNGLADEIFPCLETKSNGLCLLRQLNVVGHYYQNLRYKMSSVKVPLKRNHSTHFSQLKINYSILVISNFFYCAELFLALSLLRVSPLRNKAS